MTAGNLGQAILSLGTDQSALDQGLSDAQGKVEGFGSRAAASVGKLAVFGLAAAGVQQLGGAFERVGGFVKGFIADADNSARVMAQTEAVIKSTGDASGLTAQQVADLATSLSNVNPIDDEVIQSVTNMLLTFKNIGGDIIPQVTQTALDMAQALGTDATGGAIQLGKALNDPITGLTALQRVGVTFTDSQKAVIKSLVDTGQTAKAQQIILTELNSEFGGSSVAAAQTFGGQMEILQTKIGNVKEAIGTAFLPILTQMTSILSDRVVPEAQKFADWFSTLPGPVAQAVAVIGGVTVALSALVPAAAAAGAAVIAFNASLGVIGLIALAITALVSAITLLALNWDAITAKVPQLNTALDGAKTALDAVWSAIEQGAPVALSVIDLWVTTLVTQFKILTEGGAALGNALGDLFDPRRWSHIGDDFGAAKEVFTDGLDDIKQSMEGVQDSFSNFGKSSGDVSDAAAVAQSGMDIFRQSADVATASVQNATGALNDWTEAQRAIDGAVKQSGDAVDLWTQKQQAAQKALDDLDEIKKKDGGLNADQQAQYDTLTHFVARLGAGITDDLNPAYIDAQVQAAKFQETQDLLNKQLASGQITQDQYNQAVAAAKDAAQAALDPTTKLADANQNLAAIVDKLNQTLHDTLVALGLLPAETPVHVTDDGTIDRTKGKLLEMNGVVINTPKQVTVNANANTGNAIEALDAVHRRAYDSTFTITAYVNTGPFDEAIARIDRMTPHSPAKEGPLSTLPNWDAIFEGLDEAAATRTDDALDHLQKFANTAKAVIDTMQSELDFSTAASEFNAKGGSLPTIGFVDRLRDFASSAVTEVAAIAGDFSQDFTDRISRIGTAIKDSFDGLGGAIDLATKARGLSPAALASVTSDLLGRLKLVGEQAVLKLDEVAQVYSQDVFDGASRAADALKTATDAYSTIIDFVQTFSGFDSAKLTLPSFELLGQLKLVAEGAVVKLHEVAAVYSTDFLDAIKPVADALDTAVKTYSDLLDFIQKVSGQNFNEIVLPPDWFVGAAKALGEQMVLKLHEMAAVYDPDVFDGAKAAADAVSAVIGAFTDLFDFLQKISGQDFNKLVTPPDWFLPVAVTLGRRMVDLLSQLAASFGVVGSEDDNTVLGAAKSASDAVQAAVGTFSDLIGFIEDFAKLGSLQKIDIPTTVILGLAGLARRLTLAFQQVALGFSGETLTAAKDASDAIQGPFQVYEDALTFIKNATDFAEGGSFSVVTDAFVAKLTDTIVKIVAAFKQAASVVGTDGLDDATALADALDPILKVLQPLTDGIKALINQVKLPDRPLETFKANVGKLLEAIRDMRQEAEDHLQDALAFQATMEAISAAMTAAGKAIDTITGQTSSTVSKPKISAPLSTSNGQPSPPRLNTSDSSSADLPPQPGDPAYFDYQRTHHQLANPGGGSGFPSVTDGHTTIVNVDGVVVARSVQRAEEREQAMHINSFGLVPA